MAGDDSRALARPARTYGMNLGGFFRWRSVLSLQGASRYLGSAPPEGEKFPRKAFLFRHTRRKRCVVRDGHAAVHDASCAEAQPGKHRAAVTVSRQLIPCLYGCHDKRCFPGVLKRPSADIGACRPINIGAKTQIIGSQQQDVNVGVGKTSERRLPHCVAKPKI
jgi:hypothetical protein